MGAPGWFKVHRSLMDHWCATEPETLAVWLRMLCEANFEAKKANVYGQLVEVGRGQLIYGRREFSKRSGVTEMKLRRIVSMLESDGMIIQQKRSKFTLISIVCYEDYQDSNQQTTSKQPANNQQTTTPKEVKNLRSKETDSTSPDDDRQKPARETFTMMASRYMELIPEMPSVAMDAQANGRMTKAVNFYKRFKFTPERWDAYLMAIRQCDWMMNDRPRGDGTVWKRKNFDFLITEKCYLAVREGRYTASAT